MKNKNKKLLAFACALVLGSQFTSAFASEVQIFSNEQREENANDLILDFDDTGGDIILQFGNSLGEQLYWDDADDEGPGTAGTFVFTDDLLIQGNLDITGALTFDGAGTAVSSILDEDNMATDSDTALATQQSIKAYVDGQITSAGHTQNTDTGTTSNTFILDNDDTTGDVALQFGTTLAEQIYWDSANSRFAFTDDIYIAGNIELSGTVDGVDISTLGTSLSGHLDGGTNKHDASEIDVETAGNITTIGDLETNLSAIDTAIGDRDYSNSLNHILNTDDETIASSLEKLNTGIGDRNFTDDKFVTDGSSITAAIDALDQAIGSTTTSSLFISMNDLTVQEDGVSNQANLYNDSETGINPHQFYILKSRKTALQDLDLKFKVKLPDDFVSFANAGDLSFNYKTGGDDATDSKIDILVEDNAGNEAFTAADGQALFSTAWTTYSDEFDGASFAPVAGEYVYITIKGYGSWDDINSEYDSPYMGEIVLKYTATQVQ